MRFLFIFFIVFEAIFSIDKDTIKIIESYRTQSPEQTKKLIESYFLNKNYWLSFLEGKNLEFGYFEGYDFIFVSDKSKPNLTLYKIQNNSIKDKIKSSSALVGKGSGHKQKSGDLTTPIGVYDFTDKLRNLPPYYGPLAFTTDYPNNFDKSRKKTGYGIWIHGLPLDGNREELNTKGCIAIENNILSEYGKLVDYKNAVLLTFENTIEYSNINEIASIFSSLFAWKKAWTDNNLEKYLSFYSNDFVKPDGMNFTQFKNYKKLIFEKKEEKQIDFKNISIILYPNEENRRMFRISFNQDYTAYKNGKKTYTSNNMKIIFVELTANGFKILSE